MRIKMSAAQSFTTELKNVEEKFKTFLRENFHAEKAADTPDRNKSKSEIFWQEFGLKHSNKVLGIVYAAAAILILTIGLRALGTSVAYSPFVPEFLVDPSTNRVATHWIMFALMIQSISLIILSFITYYSSKEASAEVSAEYNELKRSLDEMKRQMETKLFLMDNYIKEFEEISEKINHNNEYAEQILK
jgi:hypothetical protein